MVDLGSSISPGRIQLDPRQGRDSLESPTYGISFGAFVALGSENSHGFTLEKGETGNGIHRELLDPTGNAAISNDINC